VPIPKRKNAPAQVVHGARVSLLIGLVSTVVALAVGVPLGALALTLLTTGTGLMWAGTRRRKDGPEDLS